MRLFIASVAVVLSVVLPHAVAAQATAPARRFAADSVWRVVWTAGTSANSETFVEPRQVVASGDAVFVLDLGTREVRGFDQRAGVQRLLMAARGVGPGEFKRPAKLVATPTGFAVLDYAAARLTGFTTQGKAEWDIVIPDAFSVADFCVRDRGRVLADYRRRDSSLVEYDTTGRRTSVRRIPWSVPRAAPLGFAHEAFFSTSTSSGACVLAGFFGREWAVIDGPLGAGARVLRYVEAGPEPVIQEVDVVKDRSASKVAVTTTQTSTTDGIVKGAMVRADTVILLGAQTKLHPHRLLDYYDLKTGKYLVSRRLPFAAVALAIGGDGTFYATVIDPKTQALIAMRPERVTKAYLDRLKKPTPARADTSGRRPPPAVEPSRDSR
jgi:hypothetical protein